MASMHDLELHRMAEAHGYDPRLLAVQQHKPFLYQKVEKSKFLGPVPKDNEYLLELMVALPCGGDDDDKVRIDQTNPITKAKLANIKVAYQVWVESDDHFVTIFGENRENISAALTELRAFIDSINKDVEGRLISLTEHSIGASGTAVEIKPVASDVAPYRPVTSKLPAEKIESAAVGEEITTPGETTALPKGLVDKFDAAVREAAERIRPVEGELRVRAHMGVFLLRMRRTNQDTFYHDDAFKTFLKKTGDKGWSYVSHKLGDETFAKRLLSMIYQTEDSDDPCTCKFMGASATILSIRDIKPKYCLVLFAKDLRIEVEVKYEPGYQQNATAESIRGFSHARRDKVVEVAVACPDRTFDWHLSVEAEANASRIPPEITNFVKHGLRFKPPVSDEDFLITGMDSILLRAANIDEVACKVSWTFEFIEKPYRLEVSVYHEWGPGLVQTPGTQWKTLNTAGTPRPIKSCGIMLYSPEWDSKMQEINDPGGPQSNFATGFPELFVEGDLAFGVENFLQEMQSLHELTGLAAVPDQH